jgi:flagellar biosynthesis component FlhA
MLSAQLLFVITFVLVWAKGFARSATKISCAIGYGLLMGLFSGVWAIIIYVVVPMPFSIATKWFLAGLAQAILLALVTFWIYKPSTDATTT